MKTVLAILLAASAACADHTARMHPENAILSRTAITLSVGAESGDIVGRDNRALQAAVDYVAGLGGGVVRIGPGEYLMRDSLHLRSRVIVRGSGAATVLMKDAARFSRLSADGDYGEEAITVADAAGFGVGRGVYVASRTMRGFHGTCGTILNSSNNYFTITRPLNADCMVRDEAFAATIFPVISGYDLQDARVEDLTVDGNRAQNATGADGCRIAGIFLYRGDGAVISNCVVRGYNGDGISFQQSNDVRVENCVSEGCAGYGFHPGSGSQRPAVIACRAIRNDSDGLFFCWRVRGGRAEANVLEDNGGYGISIGHKDSDNFIRKNLIAGNRRGGAFWRAEDEPMAAHRVIFEDNTVRDNQGFGLFIDGATDGTVVRRNTIEDTGNGRQSVAIRIGKRAGEVLLNDNSLRAEREIVDERPKRN